MYSSSYKKLSSMNSYDGVLPSPTPNTSSRTCSSASKAYRYFRRFIRFRQMDFEYAFWQMLYLFISPQKVYRNFQYRKNTKNQWARDDPAFLVLLSFWLLVSSFCFALVLGLSFLGFLRFLLWTVFIDCIAVGLVISTFLWFITNRFLIVPGVLQDVEWAYAFDVHLNAFFPFLIILHFLQMFFFNAIINTNGFFARLVGNSFWLISMGYYFYITFLGYSALPFLKKTRLLLYPFTILLLIYVLSLCFTGWNFSRKLYDVYLYRTADGY